MWSVSGSSENEEEGVRETMSRKWFQKTMCIMLAATMALGLCACGKGGGAGTTSAGGGKGVKQDPNLAKQYVYSCKEYELPELGEDYGVRAMAQVKDRICLVAETYYYGETVNRSEITLLSMKEDGSDMQVIKLQTDNGTEEDTDTGAGQDTSNGAERPVIMPRVEAAMDVAVEEPAEVSRTWEYTSYGSYAFSEAGVIYAVKNYSKEDYSDENNPVYIQENYLCAWGMDGTLRWQLPISGLTENGNLWISSTSALPDGTLVLILNGEKTYKVLVDAEGNASERKELKNDSGVFTNLNSVVAAKDGQAYIIYNNEKDNWNNYIAPYNLATDEAGEAIKMPDVLSWNGYNAVCAGVSTDLVFSTSEGLFTYNIGDENLNQIMSLVNSDLDADALYRIVMLDDEHFVAYYNTRSDYKPVCGYFTKVAPEDIPDKEVIVIAGEWLDYDLKTRIVNFNKTNEKYRIVVKEYSNYNTSEDYTAGLTQLNSDILAGNMPDILACNNQMSVDNYISKGLLADVGKLLEEDEELGREEFLQNVFDAYKVDGKLYYVIPSFYVRTMMGKQSLIGDRSTWTMQEFQEVLASMPEGTSGIGELTRSSFFYMMLQYCGSDFVDVSTGKCNFNSQDFIAMLEYAKTYPEEIDYSQYDDDYWMNYESQYRENRTLLMDCWINNMRSINMNVNGSFGEKVSCPGFPTESGKGSVVGANTYYVLSAKSANLEGAWEFIRYYLTDEYQDTLEYNIPVKKSSFDKWAAKGMEKPYYLDENGEKVEFDDYFYMNGESIPLPVMTKEQVDDIKAFIQSVDKKVYFNENIQNIITEESAAFFEGQKSAQDVANIIQSRVQIYVNENR